MFLSMIWAIVIFHSTQKNIILANTLSPWLRQLHTPLGITQPKALSVLAFFCWKQNKEGTCANFMGKMYCVIIAYDLGLWFIGL